MNRRFLISMALGWLSLGAVDGWAALLVDPTGGTPLLVNSLDDDDVAAGRPLGFPLTYFAEVRTAVDVATNGNLNFDKNEDYKNLPLPAAIARISPLWNDHQVKLLSGDSIIEKVLPGVYYSVTWKVHNRLDDSSRHVFQVAIFGKATKIGKLSFQPNDIVFAYEELGATFAKGTATIGLDAGDDAAETITSLPSLEGSAGVLRSADAQTLLSLGGGLVVFRLTAEGGYTVPNLTNHLPVAGPDAGFGTDPITFSVLANDTDADGDQPQLDSVTQGAFGLVVANANGTITYTPGARFTGTDSFTYQISDGLGGTATGTVSIMPFALAKGAYDGSLVEPPADDAEPNPTAEVEESAHMRFVIKDGGDFEASLEYPDEKAIVFQGHFNGAGRYAGTVPSDPVDATAATVAVNLTLEFLNGAHRVTGTVTKDAPLVLVAPRSANSPPQARNDLVYLNGRKSLQVDVLANDRDPNNDFLTIKSCTQGQSGDVTISADHRTLTYAPTRSGGADRFSYTVVDPMGLPSTAQVTVLAFSNARGVYDGLISGTDADGAIVADSTGRLRLTTTATGAYTAVISFGGWPRVVRGQFNWAGDSSVVLAMPDGTGLTLALHLDLTEDSHQVTGTITDSLGTVLSQIAIGRSRYRVRGFPCPQAGIYAVLPPVDDPSEPGLGWARLIVNGAGGATLAGKLGDGTPLLATGQVQMDGTVPLYVARRVKGSKRYGFITGTVTFADPSTKSNLTGHLTWWTPPSDNGEVEASTVEFEFEGGLFVPPRAGEPLLTLSTPPPENAQIVAGDLTVPLSIGIDNKVRVSPEEESKLTLTLFPKTGLFVGTFWELDPNSETERKIRRVFTGMLYRQQNRGAGVFMGSEGGVRVKLEAITAP